jgi:hypothetical protein
MQSISQRTMPAGKPASRRRSAAGILAGLPQPFSTAQARQALDTARRVAISLLRQPVWLARYAAGRTSRRCG